MRVSSQQASLMRRLNNPVLFQLLDQLVEAIGETVDIEIQRIVVAVRNFGVNGGMKCRDEPLAAADAGDRIEQSQPVVLRRGESRIGSSCVIAPAMSGRAAPR